MASAKSVSPDSSEDLIPTQGPEAVREVGPRDPAGEAVRAALRGGCLAIHRTLPLVLGGEAEGVHGMRVAANRLRGELRAFRPLVKRGWVEALDVELSWLRNLLGAVRDQDVLREHLEDSAADVLGALGPLHQALGERHAAALARLRDGLQGERFAALLTRIDASAQAPEFRSRAEEPCRDALPALVAPLWKKLRSQARQLQADDPDESYHALRRSAKRVRYAAEAAARSLGPNASARAERFARRVRRVQDVLGTLQDAAVARETIARFTALHPWDGPFQLAAGRLIERQEQAIRDARAEFPGVWTRLDQGKIHRWLSR